MKHLIFIYLLFSLLFIACSNTGNEILFNTDSFQLSIQKNGQIQKLLDKKTGFNYAAKDSTAHLLSLRIQNKLNYPQSANFDAENQIILLTFANSIEAKIKVATKMMHLTFELVAISNPENIELIIWGPYPTTINKIIGETVGVVQGDDFALGIQALNPKTLGGYPWNENDRMPQIDIFDQNDFSDLNEQGKRYVLYRVEAAMPTDFGSTLQAYCRNRNQERIIRNWDHEKYTAPAFADGGVIGSKIALFGCPVQKTLETIGEIEIAENLPHPMIDGKWGKIAPTASAAYIIMGFGENDIEKAIEVTKKAGLRYLYHPDPFENWGHFKLNKQFPNGWDGLRKCVELAQKHNIMIGVHTLSNFITTNDPYVTPIPDKRLAKVGSSTITHNITREQTDIPIASPDFFNQFNNNHLKTVVIDNELIRYGSVSEKEPWTLQNCQRGAFSTVAATHQNETEISKLADHAYKVFLTNTELTIEVAKRIADLFNKTGVRQISFDGLEGNRSTGMGNYGENLFTQTWFDNLSDQIRQHYIADASGPTHYFWHSYTRMNWGEPWYAGFRESQTEYRLKNQAYFKRNLMPGMLGWFQMTSETSLEDIEWMLARSAAFNAGYAFVLSYKTLEENAQSDDILKLLGEWEKARLAGAFSDDQKQRMEDLNNEFHLETINANQWILNQIYSYKFKHEKKNRQPGEPLSSTFSFKNPAENQPLQFILTAIGGSVQDIKMEIDNFKEISIPIRLNAGETIKYTGQEKAIIYDKNWKKIREIKMDSSLMSVSKGEHSLLFNCLFDKGNEANAKLELRLVGADE